MAEKRLSIVVDGTLQMAPHWETILKNYLEKIIRYFCCNESTSQDPSGGKSMLGLVVYGANEPYRACLVQSSGWTEDIDMFLQWLSALSFSGGGLDKSAVAEGLSNALMMFPSNLYGSQTQQFGQRQCILVAASNPFYLPRPVLLPKIHILDSGEISEARMEGHHDAEEVARSFYQSFVSLSVICPNQFPRLREIYNAGNSVHQAAESSFSDAKHPLYLVLLAENFVEAHVALNQHEIESKSIVERDADLIPPFTENFSDNDIMMLKRIFGEPFTSQREAWAPNFPQSNGENKNYNDDGDIMLFQEISSEQMVKQQEIYTPAATAHLRKAKEYSDDGDDMVILRRKLIESSMIKTQMSAKDIPATDGKEFEAVRTTEAGSKLSQCSYVSENSYKRVPTTQPSSDLFISQPNIGFDDVKVELTPIGIVLSQDIHPANLVQVNPSLRNTFNPDSPHQLMNPTSISGRGSAGHQLFGSGKKNPHQTSWSLDVNSNSLARTPESERYANYGSISSVGTNRSGNLHISQLSRPETNGSFTHNWTLQQAVKSESLLKNAQSGLNNTNGSSSSAASTVYENLMISQRLTSLQGRISTCQSQPRIASGHFYGAPMAHDEYGSKRKYFNAFGRPNISNGPGTVFPMVGKSSVIQEGLESFPVVNSSSTIISLSSQKHNSVQQEGLPSGYVKAWEGEITSKEQGQTVLVNRLVAYRRISTSETIVSNWPQTLHIDQLLSQNHLNNIPYEGDVEYLIFEAVKHCTKLDQLEKERLCAYINLPQQTLILSVSVKKLRFIGTIYNGVFPIYKHQIYNPQQHP